MGAGIPGTGMATLFYILSVFVMPLSESVRTVRGQSSWARWFLIARHLVIALTMTAVVYGTFKYLPGALLPPDSTIGGVSALAITALLFMAYLVIVNVIASLVRGQLELPQPKAFPDRRRVARSEDPAPVFHAARRLSWPPAPCSCAVVRNSSMHADGVPSAREWLTPPGREASNKLEPGFFAPAVILDETERRRFQRKMSRIESQTRDKDASCSKVRSESAQGRCLSAGCEQRYDVAGSQDEVEAVG